MSGAARERGRQGSGTWAARGRLGLQIGLQSLKDLLVDNGPQWAAAIAYYSLLSVFPLLLLAAAIAAFFVDPQWAVERATHLLGDYLPQGHETVRQVVTSALAHRGQIGFFAALGLLWSGTRVFAALTKALNVANGRSEQYGFLARLVVEAAMLLTIGVVFVLALTSSYLFSLLWPLLQHAPGSPGLVITLVSWLMRALLLVGAYFLIYQFVPQGKQQPRASLIGALVAAALFLVADPIFRHYVGDSGRYNLVYGSLAIIIIALLWVWIAALITLFGGEVAAHTRAIAIERRSPAEVGRQHVERAQPPRPGGATTVSGAARQGAAQAGNLLDRLGDHIQRVVDRASGDQRGRI
ncbi:MAG TPA: YihY/virulence factor BrkB family protein [Thermomicrobiaceae bacterium]|nr:YihY/virulence factor BrkB family protein [Thermomicrobiaceae bacterium]